MKKSRKIVVLLTIFLCSGVLFSADADSSGVISVLKVAGNASLSSNRVLTKVRTRVGDTFEQGRANEDCKRIAELKGVEYCYYNTKVIEGEIELTYVVVEQNIARGLTFVGNDNIKEKTLKRKLDFKVGDYVDSVIAEKGSDDLAEYYHKKGYVVELILKKGRFIKAKVKDGNKVVDIIIFDRRTGRLRSIY